MFKAFINLLSLKHTIRKCSNQFLNELLVYYAKNKAITPLQKYELKLIRAESLRRNRICRSTK